MDLRYTNLWNLHCEDKVIHDARDFDQPAIIIRPGNTFSQGKVIPMIIGDMRLRTMPEGRKRFLAHLKNITLEKPHDNLHEILASFEIDGEAYPAITRKGSSIVFNFDLEASIRSILLEEYLHFRRPLFTFIPIHYHLVPGWIRFRLIQAEIVLKRRFVPREGFPAWPVDNSVDILREIFLRSFTSVASGSEKDIPSLWPGGKRYAVSLTHDVDTANGMRRAHLLRKVEERFGMRSCWNFPAHGYPLDRLLLMDLYQAGHEIGCHGYSHDNRLIYLPPVQMEHRIKISLEALRDFNVRGFRSPSLLRNRALYSTLSKYFEYDSSCPDTEIFSVGATRSGCCTVYPFIIDGLVELPLTIPQDCTLLFLKNSPREILKIWMEKIRWIKSLGGLAVVNTHPEEYFSGNYRMAEAYVNLLEWISSDSQAWIEIPGRITSYWKERHPVSTHVEIV